MERREKGGFEVEEGRWWEENKEGFRRRELREMEEKLAEREVAEAAAIGGG